MAEAAIVGATLVVALGRHKACPYNQGGGGGALVVNSHAAPEYVLAPGAARGRAGVEGGKVR